MRESAINPGERKKNKNDKEKSGKTVIKKRWTLIDKDLIFYIENHWHIQD